MLQTVSTGVVELTQSTGIADFTQSAGTDYSLLNKAKGLYTPRIYATTSIGSKM